MLLLLAAGVKSFHEKCILLLISFEIMMLCSNNLAFAYIVLPVTKPTTSSISIDRGLWWAKMKKNRFGSTIGCFAKPPTSVFDLDAIEAFESKLDEMENQESSDIDKNDDSISSTNTATTITKEYVVPPELDKKRIDAVISSLLMEAEEEESSFRSNQSLSRSSCGQLIADGNVVCIVPNKDAIKNEELLIDRKSYKVDAGTIIRINFPVRSKSMDDVVAQDLPLDILYEDEYMIVINKAANMVVHPAVGNWDGTVVNALAYYLSKKSPYGTGEFIDSEGKIVPQTESSSNIEKEEEKLNNAGMEDKETLSFRPGIVHRLDKGTTGVLVIAKTSSAHAALSEAFAERRVKKTYLAVTVGNPGNKIKIDKPIGRHPIHRQRMRVVPDPSSGNKNHRRNANKKKKNASLSSSATAQKKGRRALSFVDTISFDGKLSWVWVQIATGRTHQIRVHLQDRHTPIYGDDVYGLSDWNQRLWKTHQIQRPLLHAYKLELDHPILPSKRMVFEAPMAQDMTHIVTTIIPTSETIEELLQ